MDKNRIINGSNPSENASKSYAASRRTYLGAVAAGATALAGCTSSSGTELEVGIVPDVDPDAAIEKNEPLASYLESNVDVSITLRTASGYSGIVQSMSSGQVDMAYFGGLSYVLAHRNADAEAIVVGSSGGSTLWHSQFLAHPSSGIENMEQLKSNAGDVDFAFGDPISTSGTLMPIWFMRQEYDFKPREEFGKTRYTGAHDATAKSVANGSVDAGSLNSLVYDRLVENGDISPGDDVIEIWKSPGFADYPWAVSPEVSDSLVEGLQTAFVELDDNNESDILSTLGMDKFVETSPEEFDNIEAAAVELGILQEYANS